jgi:hypothetical protein
MGFTSLYIKTTHNMKHKKLIPLGKHQASLMQHIIATKYMNGNKAAAKFKIIKNEGEYNHQLVYVGAKLDLDLYGRMMYELGNQLQEYMKQVDYVKQLRTTEQLN